MKEIAIIGCGHWGKNYLRVFSEISNAKIHIFDSNKKVVDTLAQKNSRISAHQDIDSIFQDSSIDAVVIAVPATAHHALVKRALESGKHVLVEKPFTMQASQGRELVTLAKACGKKIMVSHTFLYNPAIRQIKAHLDKKESGDIYYLKAARTHLGLIRDDVNALWDLAPHDISVFNYFLDDMPVSVSAIGSQIIRPGREDFCFATLVYPKNIIAHIHVSWIDSHKERQISIVAAKERIVFDDLNNLEKIRIFEKGIEVERDITNFGEFQLLLRDGDIVSPKVGADEPLRKECEHFIDCIDNNKEPFTNGTNGVEVVHVLEAIQKSLENNGQPINLM
jgi:predicted dehydrogenase